MSKRVLDGTHPSSFTDVCYILDVPFVVLTHLLAFAWEDFYRLTQVSKKFLSVTRSRPFWRLLGQHALKGKITDPILKVINFFHGLSPEDPPHYWLWGLFSYDENVYDDYNEYGIVFRSITKDKRLLIDIDDECSWTMEVAQCEKNSWDVITFTPLIRYYFDDNDNDDIRLEVYMFNDEDHETLVQLYQEIWCKKRQQWWHGLVKEIIQHGDDINDDKPEPFEPFGTWTDN